MLRRGISFCELLAEFGRRFAGATPHSAGAALEQLDAGSYVGKSVSSFVSFVVTDR